MPIRRPEKLKVPVIARRRRPMRHDAAVDAMHDHLVTPELLDVVQCSQHLVRWEIEATTPSGPYTLSTCFPSGRLVQVFDRASAALARQAEVQEMLVLHAQRSFLTHRRYGDGRRHL
jgi:hypothetical protein